MAGLIELLFRMIAQYSLCDITLLVQIFYYRRTHPVRLISTAAPAVVVSDENGELEPLLERASHSEKKGGTSYRAALLYACALAFVVATGIIAWLLSRSQNESDEPPASTPKDVIEWRSQALGWASALLYRKSRFGLRTTLGLRCDAESPRWLPTRS